MLGLRPRKLPRFTPLIQQLLDHAQLLDREGKARQFGGRRPSIRPVEIQIRRLVVTRRQDVVCSRPEMAVARQEVCLRKLCKILPDSRPDGIDARHERCHLPGIEYTYLDERLEQLNCDETCARQSGEGSVPYRLQSSISQ